MKTTASKSESKETKGFGMKESKLMELFESCLEDIYWAEKALTKALPKMIQKASSVELIGAIEDHLLETEAQVKKVEEVFGVLGKKPIEKKCEAMVGLIKEAEEIMKDTEEGAMRDAGIIAAAQKVEHYEIASYGTLRTYAEILGLDEAVNLLEEILDEEKEADQTLTAIARSINLEAAEEDE